MFLAPTSARAEPSHHFLRPAAISWDMLAVAGICCQLARDLHCSRSQRQRRDRCWAAAPTDVPRPKLQLLENCPPLAALVTGDEARYCILASFSKLRFKHSNTARHSTAATFAFHSISLTPCSHQRPVYVSTRGRRFGKLHPRAWATVLLYLALATPGRRVLHLCSDSSIQLSGSGSGAMPQVGRRILLLAQLGYLSTSPLSTASRKGRYIMVCSNTTVDQVVT